MQQPDAQRQWTSIEWGCAFWDRVVATCAAEAYTPDLKSHKTNEPGSQYNQKPLKKKNPASILQSAVEQRSPEKNQWSAR